MTDRNETIRECIERLTNRGHAEAAKLLAAMMEPTPVENLAREMFGHSWKGGDDGRQWDLMPPTVREPWLRLAAVYVNRIAPAIEPTASLRPIFDGDSLRTPVEDVKPPLSGMGYSVIPDWLSSAFEPKSHQNMCGRSISPSVTCTRELGHAGKCEHVFGGTNINAQRGPNSL